MNMDIFLITIGVFLVLDIQYFVLELYYVLLLSNNLGSCLEL